MTFTEIKTHREKIFLLITLVVVTFLLGIFIGGYSQKIKYSVFLQQVVPVRGNPKNLQLVNPLLGVDSPQATTVGVFANTKAEMEKTIQTYKNNNSIDDAAIYFRDLNSPFWFGINEDRAYVTASLFKLPIALAAYKEGENDPTFFTDRVYYTADIAKINSSVVGAATSSLVVGQGYFVKDLISKMLIDSDNGAKDLLGAVVKKKYQKDVFSFSALLEPDFKRQYILSPQNYSVFFRILYSATYLNDEDSDELLQLLTHTTFTDGLVAGVDSSIKVSHKFGFFIVDEATANTPAVKELHDCGIIYEVAHPYLLCVMTKGNDEIGLEAFIAAISKVVYQNVGTQYAK